MAECEKHGPYAPANFCCACTRESVEADAARFAKLALEGRAIVRRMLEDWPDQPPEVVDAEREAFERWHAKSDFGGAHVRALRMMVDPSEAGGR